MKQNKTLTTITLLLLSLISFTAHAHGVDDETQSFWQTIKALLLALFYILVQNT